MNPENRPLNAALPLHVIPGRGIVDSLGRVIARTGPRLRVDAEGYASDDYGRDAITPTQADDNAHAIAAALNAAMGGDSYATRYALGKLAEDLRGRALRHRERGRHGRAAELTEFAIALEDMAQGAERGRAAQLRMEAAAAFLSGNGGDHA